jgi:hypothetical protein
MKRIFLVLFFGLITVTTYGQKKKTSTQKGSEISLFPKLDNLQVEVKNGNFQVAISEKGKAIDAMIVKTVDANFTPANCKLSSFMASGVKLYLLTWTEINFLKTSNKTENKTTVYNVIYELVTKKQVYSNYQLTNNIVEKVTLGGTGASETQEKIRREGFEFILNPDGSITQKGKNQQVTFFYNKDKMEFKKK